MPKGGWAECVCVCLSMRYVLHVLHNASTNTITQLGGGGVGCQGVYGKSGNKYKPHKATRCDVRVCLIPAKGSLSVCADCLAALSSHPKVLFIHTHTHTHQTPCHFGQLLNMISMKLPQSKQSEAGRKRSPVTGASVESNGMQYTK